MRRLYANFLPVYDASTLKLIFVLLYLIAILIIGFILIQFSLVRKRASSDRNLDRRSCHDERIER